jgi:biopolymer transport protein ExbD
MGLEIEAVRQTDGSSTALRHFAATLALTVGCATTVAPAQTPTANVAPPQRPTQHAESATVTVMPVDLPKASEFGTAMMILSVTIARDGALSIDGRPARDEREIIERARTGVRANPELRAVILADKDVPFGRVVQVMDLLKQGGVDRIAFGVEAAVATPGGAADASHLAELDGSASSKCPFPKEADAKRIDSAAVLVMVTVGANGKAEQVRILDDPGSGFGEAARQCAMARSYRPARDANGQPIRGSTAPFRIRYQR